MIELKGAYSKDCKIFTDNIEEEALKLAYDIINHPAFTDAKIRFMPDVHAGKGINVGTTIELKEFVNPSHVGCDIGCTVTTVFFDKILPVEQYPIAEKRIRTECPFGFEIRSKKNYTDKDLYKFLQNEMNKARSAWPEMVYSIKVDEKYVTNLLKRIGMEEATFYKSLCSVGSGNHFCEYGETEDGRGAWTIHCGSRNFGLKVFKYWDKVSKNESKFVDLTSEIEALKKRLTEAGEKYKINSEIKKLREHAAQRYPKGYLSGENMKGYLTDVFFCQAYAKFNHLMIQKEIEKVMQSLAKAKTVEVIQSIHNYISPQDHIIRKGAIRAYEGEKMVIPFNMRDGLAICEGKSNPDWNYSAPHGAGRILSRSKAKSNISVKDFEKSMEGIYSTSVGRGTLDESPMAYKDMNEIVNFIGDTCNILFFIKPKINMKATESVEE